MLQAQQICSLAAQIAKSDKAESDEPLIDAAAIQSLANLLWVVKFVTPAVFVGIFLAIAAYLLG